MTWRIRHPRGQRAPTDRSSSSLWAVARYLIGSECSSRGGAFTGPRQTTGAFEAAAGGTLFLDEIGELPLELQPALLRALEAREVRRVGANRAVPIDVRVIAATNRGLGAEVNAKRFRSDLYYRLAVLVVPMPALRERPEDVPLLVDRLLEALGMSGHPRAEAVRTEVQRGELAHHPWPGNVRELRNVVERGLAFGELAPIGMAAGHEPDVDVSLPYRMARQHWVARFERVYLERLLATHGDNVTLAARAAGVDRGHLHRLLSRAKLR